MAGPFLSLIIPAHREAPRIAASLREVMAWVDAKPFADRTEVLVVDDGSPDDTADAVRSFGDRRVQVLVHAHNRGKGAAVATGVAAARGERIVFFDADLAYPLEQLDALLARLDDGADLAIGARDLLPEENRDGYGPVRRVATAAFNTLVSASLGLAIGDTQCGFKAFRRDAAKALFAALTVERFGFDVEVLFLATRWGYRIDRVPVRMRAHGASSVRLVRDSALMAADLLRIRLRALRGAYPARP